MLHILSPLRRGFLYFEKYSETYSTVQRWTFDDTDINLLIRDYLIAFWLSPEVSIRDPIISQRALARGLIMVEG